MILAFKPQFVEPILQGKKIHTIRAGNRWKVGDKIHFATGVRSKNYNCFNEGFVKSVQDIHIVNLKYDEKSNNKFIEIPFILLGCRQLDYFDIQYLLENDGFDTFENFINFFKNEQIPLKGQIIHWTDFKY